MPEYRVTTERLVEADTPQEAAALASRVQPDQWVVHADDYRIDTVVTPEEVAELREKWVFGIIQDTGAPEEEIVDAEIIEDDEPLQVSFQDWNGNIVGTFDVEIDPGEHWEGSDAHQ